MKKKIFLLIIICFSISNLNSQTFSKHLGIAIDKQWYKKDYKSALEEYNKAIEQDTTTGSYLYFERGKLKFILKDYVGAIADYDVAIKNNPNCTYTFGDRNEVDAILETEMVNVSEIYLNRAETKVVLKDYLDAIADYSKAIEIYPNNPETYRQRGRAKMNLEDYRGAIADYNETIKINPNDENAYKNRGFAKYNLQDFRGAILDYTTQISISPSNASYYLRGSAKYDLKDYLGSISDFNKAIEIDPNDMGAYFSRGLAKINLKQKNSGCLDLSKAGELGHENAYNAIKEFCN